MILKSNNLDIHLFATGCAFPFHQEWLDSRIVILSEGGEVGYEDWLFAL